MTEAIRFYCTVNDPSWNGFPVAPGRYVCVSPVYGIKERRDSSVRLPADCDVIQDSGAFCDQHHGKKSFAEALDRQIKHAEDYGYTDQISYRATYDTLVRKTASAEFAREAVQNTISAARWLSLHRDDMRLIITAQGLDTAQYLQCVRDLLPHFEEGDVLGLGGWAYIGKARRILMPPFRAMLKAVIPFAAREGVQRIHIWGVCIPEALAVLLWEADQHGIAISTDSAGPVRKLAFSDHGYGEWRDKTYKRPADRAAFYRDRVQHVEDTRRWLAGFRDTPNYPPHIVQTRMF